MEDISTCASAADEVLRAATAVPHRHGGLRYGSSSGTRAFGPGHDVRLMPPVDVEAYVKRQKNDEAICEAMMRPDDARRAHQICRAAIGDYVASFASPARQATHVASAFDPCTSR